VFEQKDKCHNLQDDSNSQEKSTREPTPTEVFIERVTSYGLPKYIQNMLVACGYRLQTVAKIRVDQSSPGQLNGIDNMLNYLNQRYPNELR